ncbi:MAG: HD domain-containing protein, partial [Chlorobi bacterium]|nr:HD domain-containing protein [Chlorobiota bacterium]
MSKYKIINDPVHGFISISDKEILSLIDHPYLQRLRQIAQMGLSYLVYPGAHHTRFQHALGAMHLMGKALDVLRQKGVAISEEEKRAAMQAVLLHDIGHGPFSHALEYAIVPDLHHEDMSRAVMHRLKEEGRADLSLALDIFEDRYPRRFFHALISGQLDTDRLDYLQRDSFYTGVVEGRINAGRLIDMMYVVDDKLCIEEKGLYSVEKFIFSRRFMYWQVYMHKTSFMFEKLLAQALKRAKRVYERGGRLWLDGDLAYFFEGRFPQITPDLIERFMRLSDADIWVHLKKWTGAEDFVLAYLASAIVYRRPFRVEISRDPWDRAYTEKIKDRVYRLFKDKIRREDLPYLILEGNMHNRAYDSEHEPLWIFTKNGELKEFSSMTDHHYIRNLSEDIVKHYL